MIETMIAIILAPIALCSAVLLGAIVYGVGKGIVDTLKKGKN
jgi:hypothetical protein